MRGDVAKRVQRTLAFMSLDTAACSCIMLPSSSSSSACTAAHRVHVLILVCSS